MDLAAAPWSLEFHSGIPVYRQIIHRVQAAVAEGQLRDGDQLPTIRALHQKLNVNPNTVARAYRELEHLGLISTEHGSGCYVTPPARTAALPARQKEATLTDLSARFAAEARSHGITLDELIHHLNQRKSHV